MAAKKGQAGLAAWCRNQRPDEQSVYQLITEGLGAGAVISTWEPGQLEGVSFDELAAEIFEAAQSDADMREASMQYAVRHTRDGADVGRCALRFVKPSSSMVDDSPITSGDHLSQALALALKQNQEMHRFAMQSMSMVLDASRGSMQLLGQAYQRIDALETARRTDADEQIAAALEQAAEQAKARSSGGDEISAFVSAFAPKLAEKVTEKYGDQAMMLLASFLNDGGKH